MELGADGVLMNTAIAEAADAVLMAEAMRDAVSAGENLTSPDACPSGCTPPRRARYPASSASLQVALALLPVPASARASMIRKQLRPPRPTASLIATALLQVFGIG